MEKLGQSKLKIVHLILMILLCVMSIVSAGIIFTGNIPSGFETSAEAYKTTTTLYGIAHVVNALALLCGITYLLKGSGKQAAFWYKTLVLLATVGVAFRLIGTLIRPGFGLTACLMIGIIIALLVLRFVKNLGERNTMLVFHVLVTLEVVLAIAMFDKSEALSSIAGSLTRLVLDSCIGLAIREKYADKTARNTK